KDLQRPLAACRQLATAPPGRLLIAARHGTALTEWLHAHSPGSALVALRRLLRDRLPAGVKSRSLDVAFVELGSADVHEMNSILAAVARLVRPGGEIMLTAISQDGFSFPESLERNLSVRLGSLTQVGLWPTEHELVSIGRFRAMINQMAISEAR